MFEFYKPYPLFQDAMGKRYDYAEVKITANTGSGAIIKPIFSPENGLGHNPINDLKSNALMFNIKPDGQEIVDGDPKFVIDQNYRQIALLKTQHSMTVQKNLQQKLVLLYGE